MYILWIYGLEQRDRDFITAAKSLKFPNYNELHVRNMAKFSGREAENLKMFFQNSTPTSLGSLSLNQKSKMVDLSLYLDSLETPLRATNYKISLANFQMTPECLKTFFWHSKKCHTITMSN